MPTSAISAPSVWPLRSSSRSSRYRRVGSPSALNTLSISSATGGDIMQANDCIFNSAHEYGLRARVSAGVAPNAWSREHDVLPPPPTDTDEAYSSHERRDGADGSGEDSTHGVWRPSPSSQAPRASRRVGRRSAPTRSRSDSTTGSMPLTNPMPIRRLGLHRRSGAKGLRDGVGVGSGLGRRRLAAALRARAHDRRRLDRALRRPRPVRRLHRRAGTRPD